MAIPVVTKKDSVGIWREKTNLIAALEGDLTLLLTTAQSDLVSAINELFTSIGDLEQDTLIFAVAMSGA